MFIKSGSGYIIFFIRFRILDLDPGFWWPGIGLLSFLLFIENLIFQKIQYISLASVKNFHSPRKASQLSRKDAQLCMKLFYGFESELNWTGYETLIGTKFKDKKTGSKSWIIADPNKKSFFFHGCRPVDTNSRLSSILIEQWSVGKMRPLSNCNQNQRKLLGKSRT
jgi:hypothetical protein